MNLTINDFLKNNKINLKYICKNHNGKNITPKITWNDVSHAKSYAIIFEDPDTPIDNFVHMYIPFINKNINSLNEINTNLISHINNKNFNININSTNNQNNMNLIFGLNSLNKFGYYGPCAPVNTGTHRYIFIIYALDNILKINKDNIFVQSSIEFEKILKKNNINIIDRDHKEFKYSHSNYLSNK